MKKIILILLSAALIGTMSACGENESTQLQADYDQLKMDYESLKADYDELVGVNSSDNKETEKDDTLIENSDTQSEILPIEIKEYGYGMSGSYLYYGVVLYNPNETIAYTFPSFRVSAKDSDGILLGTCDETKSVLYPKQTLAFAGQAFKCEEIPKDVEIEVLNAEEYQLKNANTLEIPNYKDFEIVNSAIRDGNKVVGEISNPNDFDFSQVLVTVIFRDADGKICGGNFTFVDDLKAGNTAPFSIRTSKEFVTDNYEISACTWV